VQSIGRLPCFGLRCLAMDGPFHPLTRTHKRDRRLHNKGSASLSFRDTHFYAQQHKA
jgi:hypothetical protein